jgi:hypothetical protein
MATISSQIVGNPMINPVLNGDSEADYFSSELFSPESDMSGQP